MPDLVVEQDQHTDLRPDTCNDLRLTGALRRGPGAIREELRVAARKRFTVCQIDHERQHRAPIRGTVVHAILVNVELLTGPVAAETQSRVDGIETPTLVAEISASLHDRRG